MLRTFFRESEKVQVVDATLAIWSNAKIIGFLDDWSVKIIFTDYPKAYKQVIVVPREHRNELNREKWYIRKIKRKNQELPRRRQPPIPPLPYTPAKCSGGEKVKSKSKYFRNLDSLKIAKRRPY